MHRDGIDTDDILDKCQCGAFVRFIFDRTRCSNPWRVACTECPEITAFMSSKDEAMIVWNKTMRSYVQDNIKSRGVGGCAVPLDGRVDE